MSNIFSDLHEHIVKTTELKDVVGYTKQLLDDLAESLNGTWDDFGFDRWVSLAMILKIEIEDEELAYDLFEDFSAKFEEFDQDETMSRYDSIKVTSEDIGIGSLVHWTKEAADSDWQPQKYTKFFQEGSTSPLQLVKQKREKKKSDLPTHIPLCEKSKMPMGDPIDAQNFSMVMQDAYYATARLPYSHQYVNLYTGEGTPEQYISVNPLDKSTGERTQASVSDFRYCVLEFDDIPLDDQACILMMAQFPVEAIVFTGNKSLHFWLRIDADNNAEFKTRTRLIDKICQDFGFTPDTKVLFDAASWVRCPGVERYCFDKKKGKVGLTGKQQELLWVSKSVGYDEWYRTQYPSLLEDNTEIVEIPEGVAETGYPSSKPDNFSRTQKKFEEVMPADFITQFESTLESSEDKEVVLVAMIDILRKTYSKATKRSRLSASDIFFLLQDIIERVPIAAEIDKLELLYNVCVEVTTEQDAEFAEYAKKKLDQYAEYVKELEGDDLKDDSLIQAIITGFAMVEHDEQKLTEYVQGLDKLFIDAGIRPLVMVQSEIHKMSDPAGIATADQVRNIYLYGGNLVTVNNAKISEVDPDIFPSVIGRNVAFVRQTEKGFKIADMPDMTTRKLMKSREFLDHINEIVLLSEVPVFFAGKESNRIITGYDKEAKTLVTGANNGYGLMDLEEAKKIILDLFCDFKFVVPSDLSRAVSGLILPGLAYAGLLEGGSRPNIHTTADGPGAGKGTLTKFMTIPYTRKWSVITSDSCKGGIEEAVITKLGEGESIIIIDNLKKSPKMSEFGSPTLEAMITADSLTGRAAFMKAAEYDVSRVIMHSNTNGIEMTKDMSDRSMQIAIRKHNDPIKKYNGGLDNWIRASSPRILSAVYTVINEYVLQGKPKLVCKESQRFEDVAAILNYIIVKIMGLDDISIASTQRKDQSASDSSDVLRAICFAVDAQGKLETKLNSMDIYDCLVDHGTDNVLGVYFKHDDYIDDSGMMLTQDAKKKVSIIIGRALSRPMKKGKAHVEEYTVEKKRGNKGYKYEFNK